MSISRRKFLQAGAVAAVAAGTPMSIAAKASNGASSTNSAIAEPASPLRLMGKKQFAAQLNTTFYISSTNVPELPVRLVALEDRVPKSQRGIADKTEKECFSLMFRGPEKNIKQHTYRVRHAALGEFDLFIVPMQSQQNGRNYEAIINHVVV